MSAADFIYLLLVGAALLALWIMVRFTGFGPQTLVRAIVHVIVAMLLLHLLLPFVLELSTRAAFPRPLRQTLRRRATALVYAFLSGGWATRASIGFFANPREGRGRASRRGRRRARLVRG